MSLLNDYFGPLGQEYCVYFYVLSIIFGISFFLSIVSILTFVVFNYKKVNSTFVMNSVLVLLNTFFLYLSNRLLNNMCVRTL